MRRAAAWRIAPAARDAPVRSLAGRLAAIFSRIMRILTDSRHEHCLEYRGWKTRECGMKRIVLGLAFGCMFGVSNARYLGQWEAGDPAIPEWYQALIHPDNPAVSCCAAPHTYRPPVIPTMPAKTHPPLT